MKKPSTFLTVDEAIELIKTDTRKNPTVDTKQLMRRLTYLRSNMRGAETNYTMWLLKRDASGKIVRNGVRTITVKGNRESHRLEDAILTHYKELSGREVSDDEIDNMALVKGKSVIGDAEGTSATGQPTVNADSDIKIGDSLREGTSTQVVGA